jgi:hypothetical protein
VILSSTVVDATDYPNRSIAVRLTRKLIEDNPEYDPDAPVNRQYEEVLYDYYGRPRYWSGSGHTM